MPTSLRQVTGCSSPADRVILRRSHVRTLYQVYFCRDHRWLAARWTGNPRPVTDQDLSALCGFMIDHRDAHSVFQSHSDQWMRSLTGHGPQDHGGSWAATLRASRDYLARSGRPYLASVRAALDYAVALAQTAPAEADQDEVRGKILATLAIAETLYAQLRAW